jgi:RNA polymerase sigma factor (sigma-70 family)
MSAMSSSTGWTYRVALNHLRRRARRAATERRVVDRVGGPNTVEERPADDDVWRAVRALPDRQRTAIVLRYVADLPEAAIAEAMGVSRGTVASNLSTARQSLVRFLTEDRSQPVRRPADPTEVLP